MGRIALDVAIGLAVALFVVALARRRVTGRPAPGPTRSLVAPAPQPAPSSTRGRFEIVRAEDLPTFADVGGLEAVKEDVRSTVGLVVGHPDEAEQYRITWNGVLLHGPAGVGKSFFARAMAGELGLAFIPIDTADLITDHPGEAPARVEAAFAFAAEHLPCLLFFDEFDAIAEERGDGPDHNGRELLTQLLQSVESSREEPRLVIAAATNDVDCLDPAVVRPGRFDRHIRLDVPDAAGRRAILATAFEGRPVAARLDLDELAGRLEGCTPAAIVHTVELAALGAFRQAAGTGKVVRIGKEHVLEALERRGGRDRPMVENWSWDRLVLPARTLAELREIQALVENPDRSRTFGVDALSGVLLVGPPGTGKTTVAKVLAAEASCSFYPVSGADITSKWVGESERRIARLFRRARENAPSIVFIDEVDAVAGTRGQLGAYDRQLDQLLQEIDGMSGQRGVLVIGATNRPQAVDPAVTRGGRLSRVIDIPLPDRAGRLAILQLLTARMPLDDVDLDDLADDTEGFSGADLKALCQEAALEAMVRGRDAPGDVRVTADDFLRAMVDNGPTVLGAPASVKPPRKRRS